jgi:hypothetical protein
MWERLAYLEEVVDGFTAAQDAKKLARSSLRVIRERQTHHLVERHHTHLTFTKSFHGEPQEPVQHVAAVLQERNKNIEADVEVRRSSGGEVADDTSKENRDDNAVRRVRQEG